eukprot:TRINITY_DN709_c0_g1_i1.p1 TRINITY_DN709_c0_g1~~TRINITY_DN709_c0_g1_i1.p1  ORF type:complete len:449 (+),score=50.38 TRINITY_DN709_c0_g1_i1:75-1349(+)
MTTNTKKLMMLLTPGLMTLIWVMSIQTHEETYYAHAGGVDSEVVAVRVKQHNGVLSADATGTPVGTGIKEKLRRIPSTERTIFVNIAAFRDSEASGTLLDMKMKARNFSRIHIGLVCQRDMTVANEKCVPVEWEGKEAEYHMTVEDIDAKHAKGPTFARHRASLMYKDEDYFMMIDSHNTFVTDWDEKIIHHHDICESEKCVLSVYPMGSTEGQTNYDNLKHVAYLCGNAQWHGSGYPGPFIGSVYDVVDANRPQPYMGAGLVFTHGGVLEEIPFDPHLPFLFHGEEILLTVRLWTHGYDLYSPGDNILYHHYYRPGKPRMEQIPQWAVHQSRSARRVQYLLQLPSPKDPSTPVVPRDTKETYLTIEADKYGLGSVRTVQQYWKFAGIDIVTRNHDEGNKYWCQTYKGHPPYSDDWKKRIGGLS